MEDNNKFKEQLKLRIAISEIEDEEKSIAMKKNKNKKIYITKNIGIAACLVFTLTGVVFAKDIENFVRDKFGLGKGIEAAVQNGYIAEPDMELVESNAEIENSNDNLTNVIENINTSIKIDSFLMDDRNLSVDFNLDFDEKIKEVIDFKTLHHIELSDLMVIDEEKNIIFSKATKERFEEFCQEHQITATYLEFNEKYMNNGLNTFYQNINENDYSLELIYNMYTEEYPKSKKLDFYFSEITFMQENSENKTTLKGSWELHVDVPDNMNNRTSDSYKVISCESDKLNVYNAKVTDTGFELGILASDVIKPEFPSALKEKEAELMKKYEGVTNRNEYSKEWLRFRCESPYREMWNDYQLKSHPINVTGYGSTIITEDMAKEILSSNSSGIPIQNIGENSGTYILNSNGEKFECSMSPSRKSNYNFVTGNQFDFYETFNMTKSDATDKITAVVEFYGESVKIELEKIK